MPVQIQTIHDLIRILRENAEWREEVRRVILTEELLNLPKRFSDFMEFEFRPLVSKWVGMEQNIDVLKQDGVVLKGDVTTLKQDVAVLKQDVAVLKQDVAVLKQDVNVLKQEVATLKQDVAVLKQDVAVLKQDVAILKQDVAVLKQEVATLKQDVAVLKQDVAILKHDVNVLKQDVAILKQDVAVLKEEMIDVKNRLNRIEGIVGNLLGSDFQRRVLDNLPSYLGKIIKKCKRMHPEQVGEILEDSLFHGIISEDEREDAQRADIVATGILRENDTNVLAVGEISITGDISDAIRASKRAKIFEKARGLRTIPVLITQGKVTVGAQELPSTSDVIILYAEY